MGLFSAHHLLANMRIAMSRAAGVHLRVRAHAAARVAGVYCGCMWTTSITTRCRRPMLPLPRIRRRESQLCLVPPHLCSGAGIVPGEHGVGQGSRVEYGGDRPSCMRIAKEGVIVVLKCRATSADADVSDAFTASAPRRGVGDVEDGVCGARSFWSLLGSAGPRGSFGSGTFLLWMRFRTCSEQVMHVDFGAVMRSCRHLM